VRAEDVGGAIVAPGSSTSTGTGTRAARGGDPSSASQAGSTPCDAGSSGYVTFGLFRRLIEASPVRFSGAHQQPRRHLDERRRTRDRYVRVSGTIETIERNRDLIVGVKARLGTDPCGPNIMPALEAALEAARATDLPVMLHISGGADLRQILPKARATSTHLHRR
jgi:dihydroorotase